MVWCRQCVYGCARLHVPAQCLLLIGPGGVCFLGFLTNGCPWEERSQTGGIASLTLLLPYANLWHICGDTPSAFCKICLSISSPFPRAGNSKNTQGSLLAPDILPFTLRMPGVVSREERNQCGQRRRLLSGLCAFLPHLVAWPCVYSNISPEWSRAQGSLKEISDFLPHPPVRSYRLSQDYSGKTFPECSTPVTHILAL